MQISARLLEAAQARHVTLGRARASRREAETAQKAAEARAARQQELQQQQWRRQDRGQQQQQEGEQGHQQQAEEGATQQQQQQQQQGGEQGQQQQAEERATQQQQQQQQQQLEGEQGQQQQAEERATQQQQQQLQLQAASDPVDLKDEIVLDILVYAALKSNVVGVFPRCEHRTLPDDHVLACIHLDHALDRQLRSPAPSSAHQSLEAGYTAIGSDKAPVQNTDMHQYKTLTRHQYQTLTCTSTKHVHVWKLMCEGGTVGTF